VERAVLAKLREVRPSDLGDAGDDRAAKDEVTTLAAEQEVLAGKIARARADYKRTQSEDVADVLAEFRQEHAAVTLRLAEARRRAASPADVAWGTFRDLAAALDAAPDPAAARLKLRSVLQGAVAGISLLVVPRGRDRLAAVQIHFAGGKTHRDYLILHRPPRANAQVRTEGGTWCESLAELYDPADMDLRNPGDAAALEAELLERDLDQLKSKMRPVAVGPVR
jgi:hypothetical protein